MIFYFVLISEKMEQVKDFVNKQKTLSNKLKEEESNVVSQLQHYKSMVEKYESRARVLEEEISKLDDLVDMCSELSYLDGPVICFHEESLDPSGSEEYIDKGANIIRFYYSDAEFIASTNVFGRSKYFDELKIDYENLELSVKENQGDYGLTEIKNLEDIYEYLIEGELKRKPWIRI
jgi:hypothetical protein